MSDAVQLLNRAISPPAAVAELSGGERLVTAEAFDWNELHAAIHALPALADEVRGDLILRLLDDGPEIRLRPDSQIPHLMSPRDMLRMIAVHMLRDDEVEQARPLLERIASVSASDTLRGVAARRLLGR